MDLSFITWTGHAGFLLKINGKNVYVDPFRLKKTDAHADTILITHPHFDHLSPPDIMKIADSSTKVYVPKGSIDKIPAGKAIGVEPNKSYEESGIKFRTVPAYNTVKERLKNHPKANGWVGYIINADGVELYHPGDTDFIEEMKEIRVDIALIPMSGTYVMDVDQAIEAAHAIKASIYIPMHYKAVLGEEKSRQAEEKFSANVRNSTMLKESEEPYYSF